MIGLSSNTQLVFAPWVMSSAGFLRGTIYIYHPRVMKTQRVDIRLLNVSV